MDAKVLAKIRAMFEPDEVDSAVALCQEVDHLGARVQLAALKLADKSRLELLAETVGAAQRDWRDVLAWAESPRHMTRRGMVNDPDSATWAKADRREYLAWLGDDVEP